MYIYTHTHKTSAVGCPLTINIWMVALFGYSLTEWRWRRVQTDWAVWRWTPHLRGGRTYWVSAGNVRRWRQCVCPHRGQRAIHLQVRQVDGWRCVRYAINKTVMESKMQRNTHTRTHARTHARTHPRARAHTHTHTHERARAHRHIRTRLKRIPTRLKVLSVCFHIRLTRWQSNFLNLSDSAVTINFDVGNDW